MADMMAEDRVFCDPEEMDAVLNLQSLEVSEEEDFFGDSCTSSWSSCCTC